MNGIGASGEQGSASSAGTLQTVFSEMRLHGPQSVLAVDSCRLVSVVGWGSWADRTYRSIQRFQVTFSGRAVVTAADCWRAAGGEPPDARIGDRTPARRQAAATLLLPQAEPAATLPLNRANGRSNPRARALS